MGFFFFFFVLLLQTRRPYEKTNLPYRTGGSGSHLEACCTICRDRNQRTFSSPSCPWPRRTGLGVRVTSTGVNSPTVNFYAGQNSPDAGHISFGDNTGWRFHITRQSDNTHMVTVVDNGNVGIGTVTPAERLHVVGRAIVHDGTTGTPTNGTWGSAGSRIILWPGSATATPYQLGIAPSEMWIGVPSPASWSVFRGTDRQLIVRPTMPIGSVGGSTNFPSIMLGKFHRCHLIWPLS